MKLTELIEKLNEVKQANGEMDVFFYDGSEEHTASVYGTVWTGTAEGALDKFYDAGDSDIFVKGLKDDVPVLVLR